MTQLTLGNAECPGKHKWTTRDALLAEPEQVTPWLALLALFEPAYPEARRGPRPSLLETMLRTHFMQLWFNYQEPGMDEA